LRLFIGDDSEILRERLIDILSDIEGVEIIGQAGDVESVLRSIKQLEPDLVILDIQIPGGNGIVALENIKKRARPPIVIMFTNYPYLQYRKKCIELGADFFFYKSTEFEKLIKVVRKAIQAISSK